MEKLNTHNLKSTIAQKEALGLSKCFAAYANYFSSEEIFELGFNDQTGFVYIALESGIQIASCLGQEVLYVVTDFEDGEEYFYEDFSDAELKLRDIAELD